MLRVFSLVLVCALFCTMAHADAHIDKPVVYLTFDDGPSGDGVTEQLLDVLELHNAKATFFVTGARVLANPEKIRRTYQAGHAIGNHTVNHGRLTELFDHQIAAELSATNLYVMEAGGPAMTCFRAPFGGVNQNVINIADSMGLRSVGWTIDTRDWDPYTDMRDVALQLERARNKSVVLMHDGPQARWRTLRLFTRWIEDVGHLYSFKALPECVQPSIRTSPVVTLSVLAKADPKPVTPVVTQPLAKPVVLPVVQPVSLPASTKSITSVATQPVVTPPVTHPVEPVVKPPVFASVVTSPVTRPITTSIARTIKDPAPPPVRKPVKLPQKKPLAQVFLSLIHI